ncbi:MAG: C39 family peptidase [Candidatus Fimenecus sp.]
MPTTASTHADISPTNIDITSYKEYAVNNFSIHLNILLNTSEYIGTVHDYSLGNYFIIYNLTQKKVAVCFPVIYERKIIAIFETYKLNNEFCSTLSKSFSYELSSLIDNYPNTEYIFVTNGITLNAVSKYKEIEIFRLYPNSSKLTKHNYSQLQSQQLKAFNTNYFYNVFFNKQIEFRGGDHPTSSKTLNVNGVPQGNHPWCWAATCAAIINYKKGYNLSSENVAKYIYPNNPEQGGGWSEIRKAYRHWGLTPHQKNRISFIDIKNNINANKPLHLRISSQNSRHSIGCIGYEDWVSAPNGFNAKILILLEPNSGIHKTVSLNSTDNFSYQLGGEAFSWIYTIRF